MFFFCYCHYLCFLILCALLLFLLIAIIAIVGDITPSDGIPKLEKSRMEREAMEQICNLLGGGPRGALSLSLSLLFSCLSHYPISENMTPL